MNESFDEINLTTPMVLDFSDKVSQIKTNLLNSRANLSTSWSGDSFDNLSVAVDLENKKIDELLEKLELCKNLVECVNKHKEAKQRRESIKGEIASLYSRMNNDTNNEQFDFSGTINRKEGEIEVLNRLMDNLVNEIDSITSN